MNDFRDHLATIDNTGKRKWVFAYKVSGKFFRARTALSLLYFAIFFGVPFLKVDGHPFMLLNFPEAKFIILGKIFWPQDFFILGLTMIAFLFFLVLFTAAFGRVFCGWACPQTNFLEMLFRKVEFLILGNAPRQKQLRDAPWGVHKTFKIVLKHCIFFAMSFVIANFFLSYIIGMDALKRIVIEPIATHIGGLIGICIFTIIFYGVFAFFREQVCISVCPYGRLQGVLMDKNSMVVAYDYKRGEPRGNWKKNGEQHLGDCIECGQCVNVCPTGIDIRNGTQMECVACTACIDACHDVMKKLERPTGLIRYASELAIANGTKFRYTGRMKFYTVLCVLVFSVLTTLLAKSKDIDVTLMRTPGQLYQDRGTDSISNLYNITIANKTMKDFNVSIKTDNKNGRIDFISQPYVKVLPQGQGVGTFFIVVPKRSIHSRETKMKIGLYVNGKKIMDVGTNFYGTPIEAE